MRKPGDEPENPPECEHRDPKTNRKCVTYAVRNHYCPLHYWEAEQRVRAWERLRKRA